MLIGKRLLGEIDRGILLLLEVDVREVLELVERERFGVYERMALGQRDTWCRLNEFDEFHASLVKRLLEPVFRACRLDEHADLALSVCDVLDDALGRAVAQRILVIIAAKCEDERREGLNIEQVMLSGNGEFLGHGISLAFLRVLVALVDEALGLVLT